MISEKIKSQIGGEMVIRAMFEKGIKMKQEFGPENVFDFSLGNPNVPAPDSVRNSIVDIITNTAPQKVHSYMPNAGFPEVRKAVSDHLNYGYSLWLQKRIGEAAEQLRKYAKLTTGKENAETLQLDDRWLKTRGISETEICMMKKLVRSGAFASE